MNMKKRMIVALCLVLAASPVLAADAGSAPAQKKQVQTDAKKPASQTGKKLVLKTKREKVGYAAGYNTGYGLKRNIEAQSIDADPEMVIRGFRDALSGSASAMPESEIVAILTELQKDLDAKRKEAMAKQQEQLKELGEKNKKEGEAFLKENSRKEGVKVLPDGLQYKMLVEGTGKQPSATDSVTVNYRGTLIDGTEFDSSYKRGKPATFQLDQVIKGWTEGIQLMKEGGKMQLFIPADLAYGERSGGSIGPNAVLIFDVELISVGPAEPAVKSGETKSGK
jgi:FKBP-type peptidyl-prolyl cis-trans isomerase FklB